MLYAIVALLAVIVDQWVKYWVAGNIPLESTVNELIPGVISVVNVHNSGAAFGFLSGGGARIPFIIICGVFTVAIIIALATNFHLQPAWPLERGVREAAASETASTVFCTATCRTCSCSILRPASRYSTSRISS